jgi:hypothetical protein
MAFPLNLTFSLREKVKLEMRTGEHFSRSSHRQNE